MPHISACIGSIDVALAPMAKWPTSCTRAIQALSSSRLRTVWYLLRSTGVLRAASARAAARAWGVRTTFDLSDLSWLPRPRGALPRPLGGEGAFGPEKGSPPAARGGGGEEPADRPLAPL